MMNKRALQLLTMVLIVESMAFAQEGTSTLTIKAEPAQKAESSFHLTAGLSMSSNLYDSSSPDREASAVLLLNPSMQLTEATSLSAKGSLTQEQTQAKNSYLSNTTIALTTKGPQLGTSETSLTIAGIAPTNKDEQEINRLQGGVLLGASLKNQWKMFSWSYGISVARNFHEYSINADGAANVQHSMKHILAIETELNSKWSVSTTGLYQKGWTYRGFERDAFGFETGLNYSLTKSLQVSAGFANEGSALKANGRDSNIQIYDENTMAVTAGITFVN